MKSVSSFFAFAVTTFLAQAAFAQEPPPPPPPPAPPPVIYVDQAPPRPVYVRAPAPRPVLPPDESEDGAPAARTGFQLALRSGYMTPFGRVSGATGDTMGNLESGQVPLIVDIGGKLEPHVFLGGYLGLGFGGAAGQMAQQCAAQNLTCVGVGFRVGVEVQYHFAPSATVNPWIGYGIGLESSGVGGSTPGNSQNQSTVAAAGIEYAHLMAGADFRLSHAVGIGPTIDVSLGQYSKENFTANGVTNDTTIANPATHGWILIGVRLVFFP